MTEVYEIGGHRIGVRWSSAGLDAEVRAIATAAVGVEAAPPNLSIVLGTTAGRTRTKHQLYVQGQLAGTTASESGLVRAVIRALGALAAPAPTDALAVKGTLVVDGAGVAAVVDRRLLSDLGRLAPRLRRAGRRVIELPTVHLDGPTASGVVPDSAALVGIDLRAVDRRWPATDADDDLRAGSVPISAIVYQGHREHESRAAALAELVPLVRGADGRVSTADVATLAKLTERVAIRGVPARDRAGLSRALGVRV